MPLSTDEKALALGRGLLQAFDTVNGGEHPGFRPAHAKGVMLAGIFRPSPDADSLTRAPHAHQGNTPVTVRFSDFAGIPNVADNDPQFASPRGCAIRFHLGEHVHTDIVAHSHNGFPVRTAEEFLEFHAVAASDPSKPHPNAIEQPGRASQGVAVCPGSQADTHQFSPGVVLCRLRFQVHRCRGYQPFWPLPHIAGTRERASGCRRRRRPGAQLPYRRHPTTHREGPVKFHIVVQLAEDWRHPRRRHRPLAGKPPPDQVW